jgi:hypothetical protein
VLSRPFVSEQERCITNDTQAASLQSHCLVLARESVARREVNLLKDRPANTVFSLLHRNRRTKALRKACRARLLSVSDLSGL